MSITDEILAAYLLGEATAEEREQVTQWVSEDPANKKRFYELKLIWKESKKLAPNVFVDTDAAWVRFQERIEEPVVTRTVPLRSNYSWMKAAAILVLLAAGSLFTYSLMQQNGNNDTPQQVIVTPVDTIKNEPALTEDKEPILAVEEQKEEVKDEPLVKQAPIKNEPGVREDMVREAVATNIPEPEAKPGPALITDDCKSKKFICNSTSCPIEICIIQQNSCNGAKSSAVFNCSIIQPDESGRVCFKLDEKLFNCGLAIEEIRIKRLSTGESIVIRRNNAQEVFKYISGQKNGDIIAGTFNKDCDDKLNPESLTIDNQYGSLMFR